MIVYYIFINLNMSDINTKNENNTIEILISMYHKSFEYFSLGKNK